jgi:hypothetical protein
MRHGSSGLADERAKGNSESFADESPMRTVGWHLDDVPQPFLTFRRIAFLIMMSVVAGAIVDGLLLGYDAPTIGRSSLRW